MLGPDQGKMERATSHSMANIAKCQLPRGWGDFSVWCCGFRRYPLLALFIIR